MNALLLLSVLMISGAGLDSKPNLVLLYTGNIAGYLRPREAWWINPNFPPVMGGAGSAATLINEIKQEFGEDSVLLVDTGPLTDKNLILKGPGYMPTVFFMNQMGYDAAVPGYRDFLLGLHSLRDMAESVDFPLVAANVVTPWNERERFPFLPPFAIVEKAGLKIGIIGLVSQEMPFFLPSYAKRHYNFLKEIPTAQFFIDSLRKIGVDLIVILSHCGVDRDTIMAHQLKGVDVIVSGFDGRGMRKPYEDPYTHTLVVRGYGGLSEIGKLEIWYDRRFNVITKYHGELLSLITEEAIPDPKWLTFPLNLGED